MNNDLISREALKEATKNFTDCDGFNPVWQIIDNAPTLEEVDDVSPCTNCHEWDCYGCKVKEADNEVN